jgi:hypothetical protein
LVGVEGNPAPGRVIPGYAGCPGGRWKDTRENAVLGVRFLPSPHIAQKAEKEKVYRINKLNGKPPIGPWGLSVSSTL